MVDSRNPRTSVGLALMGSATMILVLAALIGTGVIEIDDDIRTTIVAALVSVSVLDVLIGLWFLRRNN